MKSKLIFFYTYIVFLHILVIGFVYSPIQFIRGKDLNRITEDFYINNLNAFHQIKSEQFTDSRNILIGDSIIQSLDESSLNERILNWGIGYMRSDQLKTKTARTVALHQAETVFIYIGINDLHKNVAVSKIIKNVESILINVRQSCKVKLISLLPISRERQDKFGLQKQIIEYNALLEKLSTRQSNVDYIDLYKRFSDEHGYLKSIYDRGDGLHLNGKGSKAFTVAINREFLRGE
tara:strand:+ start:5161 stop:5865 length:705 start_codon:yes stop_codon:yes gene_type:complete